MPFPWLIGSVANWARSRASSHGFEHSQIRLLFLAFGWRVGQMIVRIWVWAVRVCVVVLARNCCGHTLVCSDICFLEKSKKVQKWELKLNLRVCSLTSWYRNFEIDQLKDSFAKLCILKFLTRTFGHNSLPIEKRNLSSDQRTHHSSHPSKLASIATNSWLLMCVQITEPQSAVVLVSHLIWM